jgi:hypothetical protein
VSPDHLVGGQKYPTKNGSISSLWVIFWAHLFVLTTACTGLRSLFLSYGALNGAKKWPISPKIPLKISHPAHGKLLTLVTPELRNTRIAKSVAPGKSVWLREIRVARAWFIEKLRPGNSDPEDPDQSEDERGATGQDQFRNRLEHKDVVGA